MSIEAALAIALPDHETEAEMFHALRSILLNGTFRVEQVETLAAVATDNSIDEATRCFAGQSLHWLAKQSAMTTTPIWTPNADARN